MRLIRGWLLATFLMATSLLANLLLAIPALAAEVKVHADIVWTEVAGQPLKLDIYQPQPAGAAAQKAPHPVLIVFHGGGWLINNRSIMQQMSQYIASHSNIMVVNVDYRLLSANHNSTTLNQLVEDALGAVLWVKQHIAAYQGDPTRLAVTGDSAGGHLAAMVLLAGDKLETDGFAGDSLGFKPSYLPPGQSAESLAKSGALQVQAAVLSYAVFDVKSRAPAFETDANIFWQLGKAKARGLFGAGINVQNQPAWYDAVSPIALVPPASQRRLPPQWVHVGSTDQTTPVASAEQYVAKLRQAGQPVELTVYPGLNHAYLDNGCNAYLGMCFDKDAIQPLQDMLAFLRKVL